MKTLKTSNKKVIQIYDDLFSYDEMNGFYNFIVKSFFKPTGRDNSLLETRADFNLFSSYSFDDVMNMGLLTHPEVQKIVSKFKNLDFAQARVNLSTLSDKNHIHTDMRGVTLLYYPNLSWDLEWGGHTIFTNDTLDEIEQCVAYKPGRLVIFDGTIPHCISAPTNLAPSYRFSFAIQFMGKTDDE